MSSLSRLHCSKCAEETLHYGSRCVHCGTSKLQPAAAPKGKWMKSRQPLPKNGVAFRGEFLSLREIARRVGIAYGTMEFRFAGGLRDEALVAPIPPMRSRKRAAW